MENRYRANFGRLGWMWIAAAALWLALWSQLRVEWSINPQYTYGWGVPALAAYLFWKRWQTRPAPSRRPLPRMWLALGAAMMAALLPIRLAQEANPDWRLVSWLLALAVASLTLLGLAWAGGGAWARHFLGPVVFALIAVPWPSLFEQLLTHSLMRGVAASAVEILHWTGAPAAQRGNLIQISRGLVGVNEACSGVRSFQGMLMAALFLGELHQFPLPRRLLLILMGGALSFGFNLARTFSLVWIAANEGLDALQRWHDPAGYVILLLTFLSLWAISRRLNRAAANAPMPANAAPDLLARARFLPARAGVLILAWLAFVEGATELWYRMHETGARPQPIWTVNWPEAQPDFRFMPIPPDVRLILRYNLGRSAVWSRSDGGQWLFYFFQWSPGRAAAQLARSHTPEICLPASGLRLESDLGVREMKAGGLTLPVHAYVFSLADRPLYVFYCLWEERLVSSSWKPLPSRAGRFQAVWEGRRHLGQEVFEAAIAGPASQAEAEKEFEKQIRVMIKVKGSNPA